jgi:hypothetical protein
VIDGEKLAVSLQALLTYGSDDGIEIWPGVELKTISGVDDSELLVLSELALLTESVLLSELGVRTELLDSCEEKTISKVEDSLPASEAESNVPLVESKLMIRDSRVCDIVNPIVLFGGEVIGNFSDCRN